MYGESVGNNDGNNEKQFLTVFRCHRPRLPSTLAFFSKIKSRDFSIFWVEQMSVKMFVWFVCFRGSDAV